MVCFFFQFSKAEACLRKCVMNGCEEGKKLFYAKSTKNAVGSSLKLKSVGYEKMCQMNAVELI